MKQDRIVVFESRNIRRIWHNEEWYFSVIDVCGALTDSPDAGAYWRKLKQRLKQEGSEIVTFCHGLKLESSARKETEKELGRSIVTNHNFLPENKLEGRLNKHDKDTK